MNINGISNRTMQAGQGADAQETDAYSRNIQRQITDAQKQLQELSSREDMTPEDKMKKRQEIQKEINDLKVQLRQHQMELRKEKQQAKEPSDSGDDTGMTSMLSVDNARKQAKVQGQANVLKSEIKLDSGENAAKKQEQLADMEQKAMDATASQLSTLGDANKAAKEADRTKDDTDNLTETAAADNTQPNSQTEKSDNTQPDADTQTAETQPSVQPHVDAQVNAGKKVINLDTPLRSTWGKVFRKMTPPMKRMRNPGGRNARNESSSLSRSIRQRQQQMPSISAPYNSRSGWKVRCSLAGTSRQNLLKTIPMRL